ncbi:MAG: hypothetical protein LBM13_02310 [Candidatus Ancillula sp.]|jgi:hypothetical protein|nr:hypothetical protein [Candidatus Ancillula sp.]
MKKILICFLVLLASTIFAQDNTEYLTGDEMTQVVARRLHNNYEIKPEFSDEIEFIWTPSLSIAVNFYDDPDGIEDAIAILSEVKEDKLYTFCWIKPESRWQPAGDSLVEQRNGIRSLSYHWGSGIANPEITYVYEDKTYLACDL